AVLRSLQNVQVFESRGGVKEHRLVRRLDPAILRQAAKSCGASRSLRAEKNSLGSSQARDLGYHLFIADAQGRAVALTQRAQHQRISDRLWDAQTLINRLR